MAPRKDRSGPQPWATAGSVLVGTWVGTFGNSMVPVALPSIVNHYAAGLNAGIWLIAAYILMVAVFMPLFGWFGDRYGYRRTYMGGLAGFALFSWAAAQAPSLEWLVAFRVLQGICNATTLPSVMGLLSQMFPGRDRGKAMGAWAAVNGAAHGLGPVISGLMVHAYGWQSLFALNGTVTLMGLGLIGYWVPSDRKADSRPFDWRGALSFTLAILSLMLSLTQLGGPGRQSSVNYGLGGVFLLMIGLFFVAEHRSAHPFIDLQLFANQTYSALVAIAGAQFFCLMGFQLLLPLYLIKLRGLSEASAGPLIAILSATLAVFSPFAGQIADRRDIKTTLKWGMIIVTLAAASMIFWPERIAIGIIALTLILLGVGMGLTQSPAAAGVTFIIDKNHLGIALGIFNQLRFISATLGATVCGAILENAPGAAAITFASVRLSFALLAGVAAGAALLATCLSPFRKGREARDGI
ncbi:MAG: MFS transporter [Desulfobacterales bacterium]|nr:MAG: MFS transporter [Desulfobacterales bacterium]